jgi:hypothetical protein
VSVHKRGFSALDGAGALVHGRNLAGAGHW